MLNITEQLPEYRSEMERYIYIYILLHFRPPFQTYIYISHALKNRANQRPGLPLHILQYATRNMQRVVFHSTFPSSLARNSLLGSIWGLLKSQLRNSSTPANHYEYFRSRLEIFQRFPNTSEDFGRFSENLKKSQKSLKITFEQFPKFPGNYNRKCQVYIY